MKKLLREEGIVIGANPSSKEDAIRLAGELLVKQGCVKPEYIDSMLKREESLTTYIGNHLAIPHGTDEAKMEIIKTGLSFITVPKGVSFNGETAYLIIGIAGINNEHLELLSNIAIMCQSEELVIELSKQKNVRDFINLIEANIE